MHVIATAGHVDHGKSTLIKTLTGMDPDRLLEERERGLTIDLGFAWTTTPGGHEIGFVDVPGHERFVHNMLAGVGSVDACLFVVAANEGWMPQSEEHLQILDLLGARAAVVAITKPDLVDAERLTEVFDDIRERLRPTSLAGAEIVAVSGTSGAGAPDLMAAIDRMVARVGVPPDRGRPRVFIDRVFTVQGVGTVATGTLTGGVLHPEERVSILPAGIPGRIRGIQTHRQVRTEARPVSRVALNLAGVEHDAISRGDAIVIPGQWQPTETLDVLLRAVPTLDHNVNERGSYKVYVGSAEVDARVSIYEGAALSPGAEVYARLHLASPVVATAFDRFVLRDTGRRQTAGGGIILDAHPPPTRAAKRTERIEHLNERRRARPDDLPTLVVAERRAVERADLPWLTGSAQPPRDSVSLRTLEVASDRFEEVAGQIVDTLTTMHDKEPLARGFSADRLRGTMGMRDTRLFSEVIEAIGDRVVAEGPLFRLATHQVTLTDEQTSERDQLLKRMSEAAFTPPSLQALTDEYGGALVRALIDDGTLVRIADDLVLTGEALDRAKSIIADEIERDGPQTASQLRTALDTSRKYVIPLLEYLDGQGFTSRDGDLRGLA